MTKIQEYYTYLKELKLLSSTSLLLSWDQETKMPVKNTEYRSDQLAYFSKLIHSKSTHKDFVKLVNDLSEKEDLSPIDKRSVEVTKKDLDKVVKLPSEFVEKMTKTFSLAHQAWIDAKTKENFEIFQPYLEKIVELTKRKAEYIDNSKPIYDVLIDEFEEGMTSKKLENIFSDLKDGIKQILKVTKPLERVNAHNKVEFDEPKVKDVVIELVKAIGFDFERGTEGSVHHPFEESLSPNDVRINMSYYHKNILYTLTGAIHELGHGLYEQNIDGKYHHTDLSSGVSLGIHESQSRLLENMIGRSKPFWNFATKIISKHLRTDNLSSEDIYNDVNIVEPSFIRIEADQVTYNLHIILRYEIEQMLLKGEIKVKDLPEAWNARMKELLDIVPPKLSIGCLQDVHWSMGAMGYFPTYSLGNIIAGQLWDKFTNKHQGWDKKIENGDFSEYFSWFKDNIWQHGSFYKPMELLKKVTGEELNSKYLIEYLGKR